LVNPQQIYWSIPPRVAPLDPPELLDAYAFGNRMHERARTVLSGFEGYAGSEIDLDGAAMDLPGIKGRIDSRLGDRLVEFKTTRHGLENSGDVWRLAPQDVEQLLFYAAMWTRQSREHLLLFYNSAITPHCRAFRVTIDDLGAIRTALRQRRNALSSAIHDSNPSLVKRCRYLDGICPVKTAGLCSCTTLPEWNTSPMQRASSLSRDPVLESHFETAWEGLATEHRPMRAWDLEVPRRSYGLLSAPAVQEVWSPNPDAWAYDALRVSGLLPGPLDSLPRTDLDDPLLFRCSSVFIRKKYTSGTEAKERFVPSLIRPWEKEGQPSLRRLGPQVMQLGVLCAMAGASEGYLVLEVPDEQSPIRVFNIAFKDITAIRSEVKRRLLEIQTALTSKNPASLPECAKWIQQTIPCPVCLCTGKASAPPT
jgi:hypothetical protein